MAGMVATCIRRSRLHRLATHSSLYCSIRGIGEANKVSGSSPQRLQQRQCFALLSGIAGSKLRRRPCLSPFSSYLQHSRFFRTGSLENLEANVDIPSVSGTKELVLGFSSEIADGCFSYDNSIIPVRVLIMLLDKAHDVTDLPWWMIITSSTFVLRLVLFPVLVLQLNKLNRISESLPKLPPPLPPLFSGRSYIEHILDFRKERRAIGCPSCLWFFAYFFIQVPCFILWMTSIRRMSLDHHPGFDTGGILWFQNLSELPNGSSGVIFPSMIAILYFMNIQLSFHASTGKLKGSFALLAKFYKIYLNILTLPIFFSAFWLPQGSLIYWLTNATLTIVQQLSLTDPTLRGWLGLPGIQPKTKTAFSADKELPLNVSMISSADRHLVSAKSLSPRELVALAVKWLANGQHDSAIPLLQLALGKDSGYVRALILMGQVLLHKQQLAEATENLERAISKLYLEGHLTEPEDIDFLILASQWAGSAYIRQGKLVEGLIHLRRVASLNEPDDARSKAHYFDGLLLLSSALYRQGCRDEAASYLRHVIAYNPAYREFLDQCENDEEPLDGELAGSRRADY